MGCVRGNVYGDGDKQFTFFWRDSWDVKMKQNVLVRLRKAKAKIRALHSGAVHDRGYGLPLPA
jgi:hypothetical protein